jgi:hypothetical protein
MYGSFLVETLSSILMGTQMAPELANCVGLAARLQLMHEVKRGSAPPYILNEPYDTLQILDCPFADENQLRWSMRYLDDLGEIFHGDAVTRDRQRKYLTLWYKDKTGLDIIWSDAVGWKPWLDISILDTPDLECLEWRFKPYSKPNNTHSFPHFHSYIPMGAKKGVVVNMMQRSENRCDNLQDLTFDWNSNLFRLERRGYPANFITTSGANWLEERRKGNPRKTASRNDERTAAEKDAQCEAFVVIDHCTHFPPYRVQQELRSRLDLDVEIAVRYHGSVGASLNSMAKRMAPEITALQRIRHIDTPPELQLEWDAA